MGAFCRASTSGTGSSGLADPGPARLLCGVVPEDCPGRFDMGCIAEALPFSSFEASFGSVYVLCAGLTRLTMGSDCLACEYAFILGIPAGW